MKRICTLFFLTLLLSACQDNFLDVKSDKKLLIPSKFDDLQSLLDNSDIINVAPALGFIASEFYLLSENYHSLRTSHERNSYIWSDEIYESVPDWTIPYQQVFYANVVLEGVDKLSKENALKNELKGRAYFIRANAFFNLVNTFAMPYGNGDEEIALGIPLPLKDDVNEVSKRATLLETYEQIIADFLQATELLPNLVEFKTRPTKQAAYAMLARVYQTMGDYVAAKEMVNSCLNIYNELIDFNGLNDNSIRPFPEVLPYGNKEVLYYSALITYGYNSSPLTYVERSLYDSYSEDDLRKTAFFKIENDKINFKGSYSGYSSPQLNGSTVAELYLIRAECYARMGSDDLAILDLNTLLEKRYKKGRFTAYQSIDHQDVLDVILAEREKELVGRGLRWLDLRRLNNEEKHAVILKRMVDGTEFELLPKSSHYAFPLPEKELVYNNIPQN